MNFQIFDYEQKFDTQLINHFYKSVFHNRDEFEYTRPNSWFQRYSPYNYPIIKIAKYRDSIVGTLGILPCTAIINGKKLKGGYFVDNCISPDFSEGYDEIMFELFKSVEKEMINNNLKFIAGWDYLKNFELHKNLYINSGFSFRRGINWFIGGLEYKRKKPAKWRGNNKIYWGSAFIILKFYNSFKKFSTPKKIKGVAIKLSDKTNLIKTIQFLNENHPAKEFHSFYSPEILEQLWDLVGLRSLIAEKDNKILGVATFTISTWAGLMYGKPFDKEYEEFRTITLDEFIISKEWINTNLPIIMIRALLDLDKRYQTSSGSSGFVAAIFDRGIEWMQHSFKSVGFLEARADFGVFLVKPINEFSFNTEAPWSIPARGIIAPYPDWIRE
ncbi:hypothetical protein AYK25_04480 [Thermoplasmatales archaeon SM1-50]|nr:MAG: hypothetical protein AYK25_04480 [Thermoplasmatales archaeon SM1-50]